MSVFTTPLYPVAAPLEYPPNTGVLISLPVVEHGLPSDTTPDEAAWETGLRWRPESVAVPELFNVFNPPNFLTTQTSPGSTTDSRNVLNGSIPFAVALREIDSSFGYERADYIGRATRRLAVVETIGVEQMIETDPLVTGNARLADGANCAVLNGGNRVSPLDGLALCDEAIAMANIGIGLIHIPAFLASRLITMNMSEPAETDISFAQIPVPRRLISPAGNIIVCGNGYTGVGPDGSGGQGDPLHSFSWMYATDMMTIHRGADVLVEPGTFTEALRRVRNEVAYRAMRPYGVAWSRLLLAATKVSTAVATI